MGTAIPATDLLIYNSALGQGDVFKSDGQGQFRPVQSIAGWSGYWSLIVPSNVTGGRFDDVWFYASHSGNAELYSTDGQGNFTQVRGHNWRKTWAMIIPGSFGGPRADVLFYDRGAGEGEFYRTNRLGRLTPLRGHSWRKSWTAIVPGDFGGGATTDLLFYDGAAGEEEFYTTDSRGNLTLLGGTIRGAGTTWRQVVPGNFDAGPYTDVCFYDGNAGQVALYRTDGQGNILLVGAHARLPKNCQLRSGFFTGGQFSDLLFYDRIAGKSDIYSTDGRGGLRKEQSHDWRHLVPRPGVHVYSSVIVGNFAS